MKFEAIAGNQPGHRIGDLIDSARRFIKNRRFAITYGSPNPLTVHNKIVVMTRADYEKIELRLMAYYASRTGRHR